MKSKLCIVLAGSNLNNPVQNILFAQSILRKLSSKGAVLSSSLYKTEAWGKTDQPDFYNRLFVFKTFLPPKFLLAKLLETERRAGRIRTEKWGARTLDLDLLYLGSEVLSEENLILPHEGIPHRRFCLVPLAEVLPRFVHPVLGLNHLRLLNQCEDKGGVERV